MRIPFAIAIFLALGVLFWAMQGEQTREPDPEEQLHQAVQSHGFDLAFEAVASLPTTQQAYESKARGMGIASSCIDVFLLDEGQKEQMLDHIAAHLEDNRSGVEREAFFARLENWVAVRRQLDEMEEHSTEVVLAALYQMPLTTHAFDAILEGRGYERESVDPFTVAETMASAEKHDTTCAVATLISDKDEDEQARFFQELDEVVAQVVGG